MRRDTGPGYARSSMTTWRPVLQWKIQVRYYVCNERGGGGTGRPYGRIADLVHMIGARTPGEIPKATRRFGTLDPQPSFKFGWESPAVWAYPSHPPGILDSKDKAEAGIHAVKRTIHDDFGGTYDYKTLTLFLLPLVRPRRTKQSRGARVLIACTEHAYL